MMASSNYSSSSPSRIIIDYNNQQQQSASTSSISTITTSAPLTSNILLNQSSVPKIQTQIYRVPSHFVYSNQNYGNEVTVNNVITEVKNPIFVHNKNEENHLESRYGDGVDERSNSGELHKNHVRILMYQPPIIEPPVSSSNSLNDVKLIVNEGNYGDVSTQILLQNHQPVSSSSVASTSHYSVISPYTIHQTNSNDVNNGNVEYVVLQHDNNDDNSRINTNSNEIQNQSHFTSASILSLDSMQLQEDRGIDDQDNIRRVRNLEAKRRRLENETEDDRAKRRARDAETKRVRRQRETSEQRARRLMRDSQRMRRTRRIKRLLGPTATLSDLKRTGLTLEDLDSYNSGNKHRRRSPNSSQYSSCSQPAHGIQVGQSVPSSGVTISYENVPQSHTSQIRYSNTNGNTIAPISSTTGPVATIGSDASVVNGNSTCNGFVTLHVTLPPGGDSQQPQILHLPASHTLPQHIIVQRTPPPVGQQSISTPIHQVIATTSQPHHRQLLQQTPPRQILQQRVLTTTGGPQLATIATPIIQEQRILNGHHIQQIQSQSNLNSIGISATHLINSHQLQNTHSPHSIVYRTAPPEEYDIEDYKDFIVQQPLLSQQHHLLHQHHHSYVNTNISNSITSTYTTQEIIKKKNKSYKTPKSKPVFESQQRSTLNGNTLSRINNAPISERFKGLTEDQILRRRRANAERSRRRRQLETPEQRQERNKRTAERMRARRARLAEERLIDPSSGINIIPQPATRQLVTLSLDRFEEIFQSVLLRCRNSSNENLESSTDNQKLCVSEDDNNLHDHQQYMSSQQQPISYGNIIDPSEEAILHTQMCATPSYIIVNNEQDNSHFSFDLVSESNNELKNDQKNTNKSEYLKTSPIGIHQSIDFLNQSEITEDEKPLHFLNLREAEELEEQEKLSYQRDTFKNDKISLSKLAESENSEQTNFDFVITNTALDHFSNKDNNLTNKSRINKEDVIKKKLINNFDASNSDKIYIKKNAELLHKSDDQCAIDANRTDNEDTFG